MWLSKDYILKQKKDTLSVDSQVIWNTLNGRKVWLTIIGYQKIMMEEEE